MTIGDSTPDDSTSRERADIALLQQVWGMDERDARELLRAAGMDVELLADAWLEDAVLRLLANEIGSAVHRRAMTAALERADAFARANVRSMEQVMRDVAEVEIRRTRLHRDRNRRDHQ